MLLSAELLDGVADAVFVAVVGAHRNQIRNTLAGVTPERCQPLHRVRAFG